MPPGDHGLVHFTRSQASLATSDAEAVPLVYFDSSALVKLVVEEAGSDLVADLWNGCDAALSSRLAYPEVRAALAAAGRNNDLDDHDLTAAEEAWEEYWNAIRPVELTREVQTPGRAPRARPCPSSRQVLGHSMGPHWLSVTLTSSWPCGTSDSMLEPERQTYA